MHDYIGLCIFKIAKCFKILFGSRLIFIVRFFKKYIDLEKHQINGFFFVFFNNFNILILKIKNKK